MDILVTWLLVFCVCLLMGVAIYLFYYVISGLTKSYLKKRAEQEEKKKAERVEITIEELRRYDKERKTLGLTDKQWVNVAGAIAVGLVVVFILKSLQRRRKW